MLAGRMPGVPLSDEGRAQVEALAAHFAGGAIDAVVASPIQRAQETAGPIASAVGLPVVTEPGFEEIDFGTWAGRRFAELDGDPAWARWNAARSVGACPGGETMHAAQSRALAAVDRLHTAWPEGTVVVVSHADVLKAVLAAMLGMSLDRLHRFRLDPASCSVVQVGHDWMRVDAINIQAP